MSRLVAALAVAGALLAPAPGASADAPPVPDIPGAIGHVDYEGVQRLQYAFGPVHIAPGANTIRFAPTGLKPAVPGFITRFEPNLVLADGTVPGVDEVHLHHAVWLMRGIPAFAAGEEKTIVQLPRGFGYRYDPSDPWIVNHMIHNLLPDRHRVHLTYTIDFVPASSPAAQAIRPVEPLWMDVAGLRAYPVFDVRRRWARRDGTYTFPDDARGAERAKIGSSRRWTSDRDVTLVGAMGHLHPGGLHTELTAERGGVRRPVFRSEARYWEPAGSVSWDVAMTVAPPEWRVRLRPGDTLRLAATYDARRASWYESMGIMNLWYAEGSDLGGSDPFDPFDPPIPTRGEITHGHLPENDDHGGGPAGLPDARRLLAGPVSSTVAIGDFAYGRGDLSAPGRRGRPPVVRAGRALRFRNADAAREIFHTITACRQPCNRRTGIAYPLADGPVDFDSGELGFGPRFATAAANRDTWRTPRRLRPGTYTYFCRVHPFMRGAFRVRGGRS